MSKYIDSLVAIRDICEWATNLNNPKMLVKEDVIGVLENIPAADVRPVKRGWWLRLSRGDVCSECGFNTGRYSIGMNYCPNCGADMRGEG